MGARSTLICGAAASAYSSAAPAAPEPCANVRVPANDDSLGAQSADQLGGASHTGTMLARFGHDQRLLNDPTLAIGLRDTNVRASGPSDHGTMPTAGDAWSGLCCRSGGGWPGSPLPDFNRDTSAQGLSSLLHQLAAVGAGRSGQSRHRRIPPGAHSPDRIRRSADGGLLTASAPQSNSR